MLTVVSRGSIFKGLDNKIIGGFTLSWFSPYLIVLTTDFLMI